MGTYGQAGVTYGGAGTYGSWGVTSTTTGGTSGPLRNPMPPVLPGRINDDEEAVLVAALL